MIFYKDYNISREEALIALYNYAIPYDKTFEGKQLTLEQAQQYIENGGYVKYIYSRAIKTRFQENGFEELPYDCANGIHAAKNAIANYINNRQVEDTLVGATF